MSAALQSDELGELLGALVKARAAYLPVRKDESNPAFRAKYASLDAVLDAVTPALTANGLALVQQTEPLEPGGLMLATKLMHSSGQWIGTLYPVRPLKPEPQALGSALTYARRYSVMALCAIAPEDDDGAAGSQRAQDYGPQDDAPPEPPPRRRRRPDTQELLDAIRAAGHAIGWSDGDILADWAEGHTGLAMPNALTGELQSHLDRLRGMAEGSASDDQPEG